MPILHDFCNTFEQAIVEYETQRGQAISAERRSQIQSLRTYLTQSYNDPTANALAVRQAMTKKIDDIPFEFFEFFSGVRLNKVLEAVLKEVRFSETQLMFTQFVELQQVHQNQIRQKDQQIDTLNQQVQSLTTEVKDLADKLKRLSETDVLKNLEELTQKLELEQANIAYLKKSNEVLSKSLLDTNEKYQTVQRNYDTLSKEHTDLKAKYEALLTKQNSADDQQNTKLNSPYSPLFN